MICRNKTEANKNILSVLTIYIYVPYIYLFIFNKPTNFNILILKAICTRVNKI